MSASPDTLSIKSAACPRCHVAAGEPCVDRSHKIRAPHAARVRMAEDPYAAQYQRPGSTQPPRPVIHSAGVINAERTTRENAMGTFCPTCFAKAGDMCTGVGGGYRLSCHAARHARAIARGARALPRGEAPAIPVTDIRGESPEEQATKKRTRRRRADRATPKVNDYAHTCPRCSRHWEPGAGRIVRYEGEWCCARCYRLATGL